MTLSIYLGTEKRAGNLLLFIFSVVKMKLV